MREEKRGEERGIEFYILCVYTPSKICDFFVHSAVPLFE